MKGMDTKSMDMGLSSQCCLCKASLCLRKQVINLALGNTDQMKCLICLGQESHKSPQAVLLGIKGYVQGRECFAKVWNRYVHIEDCPNQQECFPDDCFYEQQA
jgi:hypothetical protein